MNSRSGSSDVLVIGYGSLMSGLGLQAVGRLRVRSAARVGLTNAWRGFGKFSQHGDRFAMVLEPTHADLPIEARLLAADAPPTGLEGLGLVVQPNDLARLCDREGYSSGAIQRLREEASGSRRDLAAFMWSVLEDAAFDIAAFRQRLFKLIGYSSPHYIPHPVRLGGDRFGLTFLAPGREGSGSERVIPVRVRTRHESLMTITEVWQRKPNPTQLAYFATCLLGGAHGISMRDLLAPLASDDRLAERIRNAIAAEQPRELPRFLEVTGLDHQAYWQAFGPPTHSARRSGLEEFLKR